MNLLNPFAGFLVGLLVGFTGVGGGALMTPVLIFLFGVAPQTAIGTDLLFASITKGVGGWVHGASGSIDWLVFRRLALGSLPAAGVTLLGIRHYHYHQDINMQALILQALGASLALCSLAMLCKSRLHHLGQRLRTTAPARFKGMQPMLTVAAGALLGFLVTFTSVGAGALGAVMLSYLYPYRLTSVKIVGTDIAHAIPLTLVAGLGHWTLGNVNFLLLNSLLAGSLPGVILGAAVEQQDRRSSRAQCNCRDSAGCRRKTSAARLRAGRNARQSRHCLNDTGRLVIRNVVYAKRTIRNQAGYL